MPTSHDPPFSVVLLEPEIPHNTGAIGRLCVALDVPLHLVKPLGFSIRDARVRRAGLDYWQHLRLSVHDSWQIFLDTVRPPHLLFASARAESTIYDQPFPVGVHLVFGGESNGFPADFHLQYQLNMARIPMPGPHARSLNLANAAAIVMYEAYRQAQGRAPTPTRIEKDPTP